MTSKWTRYGLVVLAMTVSSLALAQTVREQPQERPPPLEQREDCELFRGGGSGNDPTYLVEMLICNDGGTLTGTFQSSSLVSGWSKRALSGRTSDDDRTFHLRDLHYIENRPAPEWSFCLVDSYTLVRQDDGGLRGTYHADDCDDGELTVARVGAVQSPDPSSSRPLPSPPPPSASPSTCACAAPGGHRSRSAVSWWVSLWLAVWR